MQKYYLHRGQMSILPVTFFLNIKHIHTGYNYTIIQKKEGGGERRTIHDKIYIQYTL